MPIEIKIVATAKEVGVPLIQYKVLRVLVVFNHERGWLFWIIGVYLQVLSAVYCGQYVLPATPEDSARTSLEPTALTSYTAVNCLAVSLVQDNLAPAWPQYDINTC